jgi:hypothetical protein
VDSGGAPFPSFSAWEIDWGLALRGTGSDELYGMAVSSTGEIVIAGLFQETLAIGTSTLAGSGLADPFIVSVNRLGKVSWTNEPTTSTRAVGMGVVIHPNGTSFVVGNFSDALTFDDGQTNQSLGNNDIFLSRHSSAGDSIALEQWGGSGNDSVRGIALLPNGDLLVGASLTGSGKFGDESFVIEGPEDVLVSVVDSQGDRRWVEKLGAGETEATTDVAVAPSGRLYVAGRHSDVLLLGDTNLPVPSLGTGYFVAEFDAADGGVLWANSVADIIGNVEATSVHADGGFVAVAGSFSSQAVIGNEPINEPNASFVRVYTEDGDLVWDKVIVGDGSVNQVVAVTLDQNGLLYLAVGVAGGTIDLGSGMVNGPNGLLVVVFSATGDEIWSERFAGGDVAEPQSISVDSDGAIVVAGLYYEDLDLGTGVDARTLESGFPESFVLRLKGTEE